MRNEKQQLTQTQLAAQCPAADSRNTQNGGAGAPISNPVLYFGLRTKCQLRIMISEQQIWQRIHQAFEAHRQRPSDINAQMAFERVAQKCLHLSDRRQFDSRNCTVRVEELSLADLDGLVVFHDRKNPAWKHGPLVVIQWGGDNVVIDGNNRVNLWREGGAPGPFEAIVVSPV